LVKNWQENKGDIKMMKMKMGAEDDMGPEEKMGMENEPADSGEYDQECCDDAVKCLIEAEKIKSNPELMAKIKPMLDEQHAALSKITSPDSSKGLDGLRETAKKRIKELSV